MEQFITKKKIVKGEVVETTYRIDADFVPSAITDITQEFIENYCVAKGETEWLVEMVSTASYTTMRKNEEGKKVAVTVECDGNYPFVNQRRDFVVKFFPELIKGKKKETEETFTERIKRLYGKK